MCPTPSPAPTATARPKGKEYSSPVRVWDKSDREKFGGGESDDYNSVSSMAMTIFLDDSPTGSSPLSMPSSTYWKKGNRQTCGWKIIHATQTHAET